MRDMVNDDSGIVEIYDFSLPQYSNGDWTLFSPRYQPGEQKPSNPTDPSGSFNLNVDNDEAIDLEKPGASSGGNSTTNSSAGSYKRNIQVHSVKQLNRAFTEGMIAVQEYDDVDLDGGPGADFPNIKRAFN